MKTRAVSSREKKTLTVPEAAAEIGTTDRALWQQIYRGRFPYRRWGKKILILRGELDEFLNTLPGRPLVDLGDK